MAFTINTFRTSLASSQGISRPNLFEVVITDPPSGFPTAGFPFQCKIATIPPSTMGVIEIQYFGRIIKIPGNRTFDNLSITILNDSDFTIRGAFEKWMSGMNSHEANTDGGAGANPCGLTLTHFDTQEHPTGRWKFVKCFPVALGEIGLDWGSNDTAEEFSVDFAYDYWTSWEAE